jgi:hypothetical protein
VPEQFIMPQSDNVVVVTWLKVTQIVSSGFPRVKKLTRRYKTYVILSNGGLQA